MNASVIPEKNAKNVTNGSLYFLSSEEIQIKRDEIAETYRQTK